MRVSPEVIKQLESDLATAKSFEDLMGKDGAIKKLLKHSLEQMLEAELTDQLGHEKYAPALSGNSRNGKSRKAILTDTDRIELSVPRDRKGEFEPIVVKKHQRALGPIEDKIISMYAKGMSTRDIQSHVEEIYGLEVSPTLVSGITDKITALAEEWQARPLERVYPIVFFDAIHYKVRSEGKVVSKAAYTCLGVDVHGRKDMLGLWVGEAEGAAFWLSVITELKNRGIQDILIACIDGLKGFPEAIESVFPKTQIQLCVIHQIRSSLRYVVWKDQKEFMKDLKLVYTAPTEEKAAYELEQLGAKWGKKYPLVIKSWKTNWGHLSTFFKHPQEIRTIIYTTNAVEAVHRQFRKVTKTRAIFPHDDALKKMLFLALRDIQKKWNMSLSNWGLVITQFSIMFEKRITDFL
jgi:transposase-like protein